MGNGRSIEIRKDPDPNVDPNRPDSVSISGSKQCQYFDGTTGAFTQCRLNIDKSISTSAFTLTRTEAPGSFSDDTKIQLIPSLPFRMYANGAPVRITKMTLYHPCPLRVENVQYDAVLSLNDPSDADTQSILLIPIVSSSQSTPSAKLLDRIGSHIERILAKDPTTSKYESVNVPTGADWALSTLLPTKGNRVKGAFFQWISGRGYEPYTEQLGYYTFIQRWKPRPPRQNYILMEQPINVSPTILATILAFPRTDPLKAIPPVSPIVTYVPCEDKRAQTLTSPVRESFAPECDPFGPNGYKDNSAEKSKLLVKIFAGILATVAIVVAVFLALTLAGSDASIYIKQFGETAGGWIYSQIQSVKGGIGDLKGNIAGAIALKAMKP